MRVPTYALLTAATLLCVSVADAAIMQFKFSGEITFVGDYSHDISDKIAVDDRYAAAFSFDSSATDQLPLDTNRGSYAATSPGMWSSVGDWVIEATEGENGIGIDNWEDYDSMRLISSGIPLPGLGLITIQANFIDHTGTVFSGDALPVSAPELASFQEVYLQAVCSTADHHYKFFGTIDSLELVPEPNTLLLVLLGFAITHRRSSH